MMNLKLNLFIVLSSIFICIYPSVIAKVISMNYSFDNSLETNTKAQPWQCDGHTHPCINSGVCINETGSCVCPEGFGNVDCADPLCGSPLLQDRPLRNGNSCKCSKGWTGLNCNVCENDDACNVGTSFKSLACNKDPLAIEQSFMQCDVKNKVIVDALKDKKPQVTISCLNSSNTCQFQFWVGGYESFYCGLENCKASRGSGNLTATYHCKSVKCHCIPNRMLCGQDGSVDLSDWFNDDEEGPSGPAMIKCDSPKNPNISNILPCVFDEPHMNDLITDFFGDPNIILSCNSGECVPIEKIPNYAPPYFSENPYIFVFGLLIMGVLMLILFGIFHKSAWRRLWSSSSYESLPDNVTEQYVHHQVDNFSFENIVYKHHNGQVILHGIQGIVNSGEIMAVFGTSGAGKSSLIDILAGQKKRGEVHGEILVGGQALNNRSKKLIGYVQQEDIFFPGLTVYETVLFSALLRLPETMPIAKKYELVNEVINELNLSHVAMKLIGDEKERGISGGEKRRVSIACELVAGATVLILDEPTSGLDAYNAYNVIETLYKLAKHHGRCIILSIHQPRSNIFSMFDQVLLLSQGRQVYSGPTEKCLEYFQSLSLSCPNGYNTADFLIDLTVNPYDFSPNRSQKRLIMEPSSSTASSPKKLSSISGQAQHDENDVDPILKNGKDPVTWAAYLAETFMETPSYSETLSKIRALRLVHPPDILDFHRTDESVSYSRLWNQLTIISSRSWKKTIRDPQLLAMHYSVSIIMSLIMGTLFFGVTNDISGFQNRMGLIFFVCSMYAFGCISSISAFSKERSIFARERTKGYYETFTFFWSQLIFDFLLLRTGPPILLSLIMYPLVGLRVDAPVYQFNFILALVLFNLNAFSLCFLVSMVLSDASVASLVTIMIILFHMLFGGLLLNNHTFPPALQMVRQSSFFNSAMEALIVNEINGLTLKEYKYGLSIDVPGAILLQTFGFNALGFKWDMMKMLFTLIIHLSLAFIWLKYRVKQRK